MLLQSLELKIGLFVYFIFVYFILCKSPLKEKKKNTEFLINEIFRGEVYWYLQLTLKYIENERGIGIDKVNILKVKV